MRVAKLAGLLILCCAGRVQSQETDIRVPFPQFAPRPSATVIYCRATVEASVHGNDYGNSSGKFEDAHIKATTSKFSKEGEINGVPFDVRLTFSGTKLLVSKEIGPRQAKQKYGGDFPYKVLNDDPGNFFAMSDSTSESGYLAVISLDRETGTMVLTDMLASLPNRGHPYTRAVFYVCKERAW